MEESRVFSGTQISGKAVKIGETLTINESVRLTNDMPAIKKVLYNETVPVIESISAYGSALDIKGKVRCSIFYESENSTAESLSTDIPFEYSVENELSDPTPLLNAKAEKTETDISKPRRADITVKIKIEGYLAEKTSLSSPETAAIPGLVKKTETKDICLVKNFRSSDSYSFKTEAENLTPSRIACCGFSLRNQTATAGRGGILYAAEIEADIICETEDENGKCFYNRITDRSVINKMIDTQITDIYNNFELNASIAETSADLNIEESGYFISYTTEISFDLTLLQNMQEDVISDMYSTEKELELKAENAAKCNIKKADNISLSLNGETEISSSGDFTIVACPVCKFDLTGEKNGKGIFNITGNAEICVLVLQNTEGAFSSERITLPIETTLKSDADELILNAEAFEVSFKTSSGTLFAELKAAIKTMELKSENVAVISEVSIAEKETEDSDFITLRVHYFSPGEDLWNTAKSCRTTQEKILSDNSFETVADIPAGFPLMIG